MKRIINTYKGPLCLPDGTHLAPGVSTPVYDWAELSKNHVISAWVKAGVLIVDPGPPSAYISNEAPEEHEEPPVVSNQDEQIDEKDEKDELIAKLAGHGIHKDRRSSVETLKALLAEVE